MKFFIRWHVALHQTHWGSYLQIFFPLPRKLIFSKSYHSWLPSRDSARHASLRSRRTYNAMDAYSVRSVRPNGRVIDSKDAFFLMQCVKISDVTTIILRKPRLVYQDGALYLDINDVNSSVPWSCWLDRDMSRGSIPRRNPTPLRLLPETSWLARGTPRGS